MLLRPIPLVFCALAVPSIVFAQPDGSARALYAEGGSAVLDMVLASIDGEPLTMSDLRQYISSRGDAVPADLMDGSKEVRKFLRDMIIDEVTSREAQASNVSVSEEEVEAYIEEIKRQNGVDEEGFEALLKSRKMALASYKQQVRSDIIRNRLIGSKVRPKINVLESEIRSYLDEHPELQPKSGEVRVEQVLLKYPEGADESAQEEIRARANQLRADVAGGKDLSSAAKDDYTDLGFVSPSDLRPVLAEAVRNLNADEAAIAEEPGTGIYVLKVSSKSDGAEMDDDVRQQVRRQLFESKIKDAVDKYFNDELPKKYHVELKL